MGLRAHLDAALAQGAGGELLAAADGLDEWWASRQR
jgi:hypothetical protein